MTFEGALVEEQGIRFAVVIVQPHVLNNSGDRQEAIAEFTPVFGGIPVVLMAQDTRGLPTYYGRKDISAFLAKLPLRAIPWQRFSFN